MKVPALLTSTSACPNLAFTFSQRAVTESALVRSVGTGRTSMYGLMALISWATAERDSAVRATRTIALGFDFANDAANACEVVRLISFVWDFGWRGSYNPSETFTSSCDDDHLSSLAVGGRGWINGRVDITVCLLGECLRGDKVVNRKVLHCWKLLIEIMRCWEWSGVK